MSLFTAQALIRTLQMELGLAIAGATFASTSDANGYPVLELTASGESIYFNIIVDNPNDGRVNGVGVAQAEYSPHTTNLLQTTSPGTSSQVRYLAMAKAAAQGTLLNTYEIASLPAITAWPAGTGLAGATLISSNYPDTINKLTDRQ